MDTKALDKQIQELTDLRAVIAKASECLAIQQQHAAAVSQAEARVAALDAELAERQKGLEQFQANFAEQRQRLQQQMAQERHQAAQSRAEDEQRSMALKGEIEKFQRQLDKIRQEKVEAEAELARVRFQISDALTRAQAIAKETV